MVIRGIMNGYMRTYWVIVLESGIVLRGHNDVQTSNGRGTKLSLNEDLSADIEPFLRLTAEHTFGRQHPDWQNK
jgi:hypothetical protein